MKFAVLLFTLPLFGQLTNGGLTGVVLDPSGAGVNGARIVVEDTSRGYSRTGATEPDGSWRIVQLPVATYRVTVSRDGFATQTAEAIRVEVDSIRRLDFRLQLGDVRQSMEIRESLLQTEATDSGTVLQREQIAKLPLNRRGFLQLALLVPGVNPPVQDSELSTRGTFAAHANGAREEFNNFLLDGVDNNDLYTNRYVIEPPVDTIQEFKLTAGSYSAEYGRSGGAQVNVITRGGTNEWHGLAYEYFRNRALDAANAYDGGVTNKYIRNQFGGLFGGPIVRDKAFFLLNADGLVERRGLTRLATVPTLAERNGDLSGRAGVVRDPFTFQPFPGNIIPASRIHPVSRHVMDLFPLPNRPGTAGNYLAQPVLREAVGQGGARADWHLRPGGLLTMRYQQSRQDLFEPYAEDSTDVPGFGSVVDNTGHNAMIHHQQSLGASFLHSLRLGFNRNARAALPENFNRNVAELWNVPWLANVAERDRGYPFFNVQGFSPVGDATSQPLIRFGTTLQVQEDISWLRGAHSFKAGFQVRNTRVNGVLDLLARGSLSFSGAVSGSGISDVLLGIPSFALRANPDNPQTLRTTSYAGYFQDEWRVSRKLSLTAGLRYEYNSPATDPFNRMAVFQADTGRVVRVGESGVPRSGIRADRNNFAPRFGFAYSATDKTVLRGGYGLYYDAGMLVLASSQYFNPPFFTLRAFFPTATSIITLSNPFPSTGGISPVSPSTLSPDITTASIQHWNLEVQRQFGSDTTVSVAYVGSAGAHLIRSRDLNQARPGSTDLTARRPYPQYSGIVFIETAGNSNYHALQARMDRRFSRRLSLLASYTWSKSIDDTSAFLTTKPDKNFPQDSLNFRAERGVSSFDIPHRATAAFVVSLPAKLELRGITVAQAGQAFTPLLRFDNSNSGNTGGNFGSDRPNVVGNPRLEDRTPERWFNTSALAVPPRFTFGNAGRNILRGPGYVTMDASVARRFRITERLESTLELQSFNLLNRVNYDLPERYADEPSTFGRIFSAKAPRQLQLVFRLSF